MFNCYELYMDNELYCICPTWARAKCIAGIIGGLCMESEFRIEGKYIPNIGF